MIVKSYNGGVTQVSFYVSDIIPLKVGTKWIYKAQYKIFSKEIVVQVMDKRNDYHLIKFKMNDREASIVLQSNVDLFVTGYSPKGVNTLRNHGDFKEIPKTLILKSPVLQGNTWQNSFGIFKVQDTNHRLKLGDKIVPDCIRMHLKDTSNADNEFFIKEGIGIVYANVYLDNIGSVGVFLKKFN